MDSCSSFCRRASRKAAGESDKFEKEEFARLAAQAKVLKEKQDALWAEPEPEQEVQLHAPSRASTSH